MGPCRSVSILLATTSRDVGHLLLEQDRSETSVKRTKTLLRGHLAHTADQPTRVCGLRHKTNARRLKRAQGDIREELSTGGRSEVDSSAVVGGSLVTESGDGLLLEELVPAELESALEEVTGEGWAGTGEERAGAVFGDDLAETADQALVVGDGVELDASLDAGVSISFMISPDCFCFFALPMPTNSFT